MTSSSNSSTCFYVIIDPSVIDDRQLRMPDQFVQAHGNELLNTVRLIVPTDEFWCVGLRKAGRMIWLHDGWLEFMEHHSIDCWYFLFFKYEQNSCFNVHIFDLTATEIHYQLRSWDNAKLWENRQDLSHEKEIVVGDKDGESSVEIVGISVSEPQSSVKSYELSCGTKRRKVAPGRIKYWRCYETRSRASKWHDVGRLLNAKNLNVVRDSSLTKPLMGKSVQQNMDASTYAVVAGGVTNQDNALEGNAVLQLSEKTDTESSDAFGAVSSNRTNCKTDESKSFTCQNLKKSSHERPYKRRRSSAVTVNRAINAAKRFIPKNPYFMRILEKHNVLQTYILNVPAEFTREYLPKTSQVIELQDSDCNKWNVRCIRRKNQSIISKGWLTFVRDKNLAVGDVCVFELLGDIQTDEVMLKVQIFRSREEENLMGDSSLTNPLGDKLVHQIMETPVYSVQVGSKNEILLVNERKHTESSDTFRPVSPNRTNGLKDTSKSFTYQQLEKPVRRSGRPRKSEQLWAAENNVAVKAAKMCVPENPYFMQILEKYNVVRSHVLYIPAEFVQKYMKNASKVIKLQDSACNQWDAHCVRRKYDMFLSKGWWNFVKDNNLMEGDGCVFELTKDLQADEIMLKVHIFRSRVEENSTNLHTCSISQPKLYTGKNSSLQFNESKHTKGSDILGAVSSDRTNWKTDASQSITGQKLEKSVGRGRQPRRRGRPSAPEVNTAINAAKSFIPKNPYFMHILEEYNVIRNYVLNIPSDFTREYMPKTSKVIELQDSDGNKWDIGCIRRKHNLCLSRGWSKFVKDKSIAVGDVCVFELIKDIQTDELMLKVHIFHSREEGKSTDTLVACLNQLSIGE